MVSIITRTDIKIDELIYGLYSRTEDEYMKLDYSLSMWNYEAYTWPKTFEDAVAEIRRSGYGVEIWPNWKSDKNLFAPENRDRLVSLIKDMPSSFHGGTDAMTLDEHKIQIDAARDTASSVIVVHANTLGLDEQPPHDYGLAREVVVYAKTQGVTIALENGGSSGGRLDSLSHTLDNVPDMRACLDIGHVFFVHDHPLKEYLERLDRQIVHLHLQDVYLVPGTRRAKDDSHRTPGQCDISVPDWQMLFSKLQKIGYKGHAVFEIRPFTPDEIAAQATEFLESIGG
jgi:sugar phosphate isomerase/epimerase